MQEPLLSVQPPVPDRKGKKGRIPTAAPGMGYRDPDTIDLHYDNPIHNYATPSPPNLLYTELYTPSTADHDAIDIALQRGIGYQEAISQIAEQIRRDEVIKTCYNLFALMQNPQEFRQPGSHEARFGKFQELLVQYGNSDEPIPSTVSIAAELDLARFFLQHPEVFFPHGAAFIGEKDFFFSQDVQEVVQARMRQAGTDHPLLYLSERSNRYPNYPTKDSIAANRHLNLAGADIYTNLHISENAVNIQLEKQQAGMRKPRQLEPFSVTCRNFVVGGVNFNYPLTVMCDNLIILHSELGNAWLPSSPYLQNNSSPRISVAYKENFYNVRGRTGANATIRPFYAQATQVAK